MFLLEVNKSNMSIFETIILKQRLLFYFIVILTYVLMMKNFYNSYSLNSLTKQLTCFKNPENPTCIDLILTNKPRSFQSTCVIETGLSDFYRITVSVLKTHFRKLPSNSLHTETLKSLKMRGLWIP